VKETVMTVIGNVVGPPQRNRTANGSVTNFRVASTSRRYDKDVQGWVDNKTLFLDVECWGELGGNVSQTVSKGDPVIVHGTLFTDEWESEQGRRSRTKLRAEAVGPDLTKGTADFRRAQRPSAAAPEPDAIPPAPPEEDLGDVPDYPPGSGALYELDPDSPASSEPALR
jgi:single-strand DNA-binding protein